MKNQNGIQNEIKFRSVLLSFKYWPKIIKLFWETRRNFFLIVLFMHVLQGFLPFISVLITQGLINSIELSWNYGFQITIYFFIAFIFMTIFKEIVSIIQNYYQSLFQTLFVNKINVLIMEKSNQLDLKDFEDPDIQDQLKRAQNESGHRPFQTFLKILSIISNAITLISSVIFLFIWKWWVAFIFLSLPLISFYSFIKLGQHEYLINWRRAPKWRKSWYLTYIMTFYTSFKEVKMNDVGPYIINKYKNIIEEFYEEDKKILKKRLGISFFFELINISVLVSIIYLVIKSTFRREILIGNMVGYIQAINLTHTSSQGIARGLISLCQDNMFISQLFLFLELKSSVQTNNIESNISTYKKIESQFTELREVEFRNVSFRYPNKNTYTLKNINFKVSSGEILAIVGKNGSGKSTLVKLLMQIYDGYEGEILINGSSIKDIDKNFIYKKIGVLFQDFMRFELPMRENIGFGDVSKMNFDENLFKVVKQAGIKDLVDKLPKQLDTQLGSWFEDSYQLSGGEWQRIAIARSYLKNADIYILDEPSAALDPLSEDEVFMKFKGMVQNKIGIFISHRFSSMRIADKILVLEDGRLVEYGSHDELLLQNGIYSNLYKSQVSNFLPVIH